MAEWLEKDWLLSDLKRAGSGLAELLDGQSDLAAVLPGDLAALVRCLARLLDEECWRAETPEG